MKIDKIIAISGKPGLYEIINQTKGGIIVESLQDKKRFPINSIHNVSTLSDIAIYTDEEEKPLKELFLDIYKKEDGKKSIDHKAGKEELISYFSEVLPNYDDERVYPSNIKKVIQWYNSLLDSDFDFKSLEEKEDEDEEVD
ncbi:MAG: DUF5606 domain-containing protein, partial [Flavobacteriaceae bacterium]|nr:DUF5606 domain-containing protein [Flavobacteriaceae bacterium]